MRPLLILLPFAVLIGCSGDTATRAQPSAAEIQAGRQRRLAEIDKLNVPEAAKQRMREQVNGGGATR